MPCLPTPIRSCTLRTWLMGVMFRAGLEEEFLQGMALQRRPVLLLVFSFDLCCYLVRALVRGFKTQTGRFKARASFSFALDSLGPQLLNMLALYTLVAFVNRRSSRLGSAAARQVRELVSALSLGLTSNTLVIIQSSKVIEVCSVYQHDCHH